MSAAETGHCGWFGGDIAGLRVSGSSLLLADCWRVSGEVGAGVERWLVAAECFGGGGLAVRRGRRGASRARVECGGGFAPQGLVCQRKHIFRKVFVQAKPGKEGGFKAAGRAA